MSTMGTCPSCGVELPADAPKGFCPRCLYRLGFQEEGRRIRYFGDYELEEEVAHGGMGVVYRARQVSLDRTVAVKMIRFEESAGPEAIARFRREAQAAANLQHPNIIAIHEVGEHEGQHYFSMEYVEGKSLANLARGTPIAAQRAARYVKAIAEAIHFAHQHGILHRDLKPSNVLIDTFDQPKVTDFGIAKSLTELSDLTFSGQVLGTPNYLPPEQCGGRAQKSEVEQGPSLSCSEIRQGGTAKSPESTGPAVPHSPFSIPPSEIGPSSDVYGLGGILFYLLTGRPPFVAESLEATLAQVLGQDPVVPTLLNPVVPRDLETICLRCLEKEPRRRYSTAQEVADELGRFLRQEPIVARPLGLAGKAWRWCRRQPVRAGLIASLAAVFLSGAAGVLWQWREADAARRIAERAKQDLVQKLWASHLAEARASRWSGRAGRRFASLEAIRKAAAIRPSSELRNEAIACLTLPDARVESMLRSDNPGKLVGCAFDDRFERYAGAYEDASISIRRLRDDVELLKLPGRGRIDFCNVLFSPDGRFLVQAALDNGALSAVVWDSLEGRQIFSVSPPVRGICFTPDSRQVALGEAGGRIGLYSLPEGTKVGELAVAPGVNHLAFDPPGKRLAVSRIENPSVIVLDLASKAVSASLANAGSVGYLAWSPEGRLLACPSSDERVYLWNVETGERQALGGHAGLVTAAIFNHLGDVLVSMGWDGVTWFWDPKLAQPLVSLPGGWIQNGFDPNDRRLGFGVDELKVGFWQVEPARECRRLGRGAPLWRAEFSPDGRVLATASSDGVRLWNVNMNRLLAHLPMREARSAIWHPNGTDFITTAAMGIQLWPVEFSREATEVRIGTARHLSFLGQEQGALIADGHGLVVAFATNADLVAFDLENSRQPRLLNGHPGAHFVSVSPDGDWFATGTWHGTGVKVWSTKDWQPVKELQAKGSAQCAFSPDGKWLLTGSPGEYRLWNANSWEPGLRVPRDRAGDMYGSMAFSADSRVAALLLGRNREVKLISIPDGRELATLDTGEPLCFSRDGSQLATAGGDHRTLLVWDLGLIRRQLREMALDWE